MLLLLQRAVQSGCSLSLLKLLLLEPLLLQLGVAWRRVRLVVFEAVQVLVSFVAHVAFVWLLLLHTYRARIWLVIVGIQDGEGAVSVLLQPLVLVPVSLVVFQAVRVTVRFV